MKNKNKYEEIKIYTPKEKVVPEFVTNPITDNFTDEKGRVYNRSVENVILSKEETDANHK